MFVVTQLNHHLQISNQSILVTKEESRCSALQNFVKKMTCPQQANTYTYPCLHAYPFLAFSINTSLFHPVTRNQQKAAASLPVSSVWNRLWLASCSAGSSRPRFYLDCFWRSKGKPPPPPPPCPISCCISDKKKWKLFQLLFRRWFAYSCVRLNAKKNKK